MIPRVLMPLLFLTLFILFFISASSAIPTLLKEIGSSNIGSRMMRDSDTDCVYTIYVRTGTVWKGGTDSVISMALAGSDGWGVLITDLVNWGGLMGSDHDYYERGNLDIFSGRGPCLSSPPCWMNLTSDGSGPHHGWYCNYVQVTTTGPHQSCQQQLFTVEQWLATDASPYQLYATRDNCAAPEDHHALQPSRPHAPRRVAASA